MSATALLQFLFYNSFILFYITFQVIFHIFYGSKNPICLEAVLRHWATEVPSSLYIKMYFRFLLSKNIFVMICNTLEMDDYCCFYTVLDCSQRSNNQFPVGFSIFCTNFKSVAFNRLVKTSQKISFTVYSHQTNSCFSWVFTQLKRYIAFPDGAYTNKNKSAWLYRSSLLDSGNLEKCKNFFKILYQYFLNILPVFFSCASKFVTDGFLRSLF